MTLPDRFWEKVDRSGGIDDCWLWTAHTTGGYGRFAIDGRLHQAHRLVAEAAGLDMSGVIHHVCETKSCQNPLHLEAMASRSEHAKHHDLGSRNRFKTHCDRGHPLAGVNLYVDPVGKRHCKVCRRVTEARYRASVRERLAA